MLLDRICDVRDYLDSLAQVISSPLLLENMAVNLSSGDVALACQLDAQVSNSKWSVKSLPKI